MSYFKIKNMKKTLLYHLYVDNEIEEENYFYRLHQACLSYYIHVFDETIFYIAVDDLNNKNVINKAFEWVSSICKNKSFIVKVVENKLPFESGTLMAEVINKRKNIDGMIFFAHTKGKRHIPNDLKVINDEVKNEVNINSMINWVLSLYFYSLNFIDEAENLLYGKVRPSELFYGPFLTQLKDPTSSPMLKYNKGNCHYAGTFYWINTEKFNNYLDKNIIELPKLDDRYWAEMLPGVVGGRYRYGDGCASHNDIAINDDFNLYKMNESTWDYLLNVLGDKDEFIRFRNIILDKI